jgi:hypothetical protein
MTAEVNDNGKYASGFIIGPYLCRKKDKNAVLYTGVLISP